MKNKIVMVQNIPITITNDDKNDYICISDIAKAKEGNTIAKDVIKNWLRNRYTLEFLGTWEKIYNPSFKGVEFDSLKLNAGLHSFILSVTELVSKTNVVGIYAKKKDMVEHKRTKILPLNLHQPYHLYSNYI